MSAGQLPIPPGRFTISKVFELNGVSHELRLLPEGHQCRRNHGHNYVVTVTADRRLAEKFGSFQGEGPLTGQ